MEGYRRQTEPNVSHGASVDFNYTQTLSDLRLDLRVSSQTNSKPAPSPPNPTPPQPLAVQHQSKHVTHMLFISINLLILPCLPPHTHTKTRFLTSYEVYTPPCFMFPANLVLRLPSPPSTLFHFVSVSLSLSLCHPSLPLSLPPPRALPPSP